MFVLRAEIVTIFEPKMVTISARNTNILENMQTSQGYIFYILQHFQTKFCNFTNFTIFFGHLVCGTVLSKNTVCKIRDPQLPYPDLGSRF
jgi:hypothetical protein